jgi:L-2,4-diaminobutyrate decarboxylase
MVLRSQTQAVTQPQLSPRATDPQDAIFNEKQLSAWAQQTQDVLALMTSTVNNVEKPFSGILPHELAPQFINVDLDQPLGSNEAALEELKDLYLRDAVWFHHPKYVAHLNCPVVLPSLLAEQIMAAVNSSVDTWDQSAGGTLIEQKVIDWTLTYWSATLLGRYFYQWGNAVQPDGHAASTRQLVRGASSRSSD